MPTLDLCSHVLSFQINQSQFLGQQAINNQEEYCKLSTFIEHLQHQITTQKLQIKTIREQFEKERQLNFILKGLLNKIEKMLYNQHSSIFEQQILDYQKIELHFKQMLRRMQDVNITKLSHIPVIYRRQGVKNVRIVKRQQQ